MTTLDICLLQWNTFNTRMQKIFEGISEDNFNKPITPNGNSPSWILGHLTEADDALLELFAIGNRKYPELKTVYNHERGKNQGGHLTRGDLYAKWKAVNDELTKSFKSWSENEWLSRHTAVSEEDFKKEPHRNKLNVMLSRVSHRAAHLGQIAMQPK